MIHRPGGNPGTNKKVRRNLSIPTDYPVQLRGLEPLTPCMPCRCATSCATAPDRCRKATRGILANRLLAGEIGSGGPVGVSADGTLAVHHAQLPADHPALHGDAADGRRAGRVAARVVTGLPLT